MDLRYKYEFMWQKITILVGIIILPLAFICLYFLIDNKNLKICIYIITVVSMTMIIGTLFISFLFIFLLELRKKLGIYANNFLPMCTTFFWFFILVPLLVATPIAVVYLDDTNDNFKYLSGGIVGFISVMLMIGISIGAIIINYVFKQMEAEDRANFVTEYVAKKLTKIAVRSRFCTLRLLYEEFLINEEKFTTALYKKQCMNYWAIPEMDPDIYHNKALVTKDEYEQLSKHIEGNTLNPKDVKIEKIEDKKSKVVKKKLCCACCYESDDEDDYTHEEEKSECSIIREEKDDFVDFHKLISNINEDEDESLITKKYIKPFNAVVSPFENSEVKEKKIPYEQFLEIVENSKVNNRKLVNLLIKNGHQISHRMACHCSFSLCSVVSFSLP